MSYKVKYSFDFGAFKEKDVKRKWNEGLCDAFLFASIIKDDGATSTIWLAAEEDGKPMSTSEQFIQWGLLAKNLAESAIAPEAQRICEKAFNGIRALKKYAQPPEPNKKETKCDTK